MPMRAEGKISWTTSSDRGREEDRQREEDDEEETEEEAKGNIREMRAGPRGGVHEDFSAGSHGQVGPPMAFSRCAGTHSEEGHTPPFSLSLSAIRLRKETDRVLRST